MKGAYFAATLVVVAALSYGAGAASTYVTADGEWWRSVPADARTTVATGMIWGYLSGWSTGEAHEAHSIDDAIDADPDGRVHEKTIDTLIKTVVSRNDIPSFSHTTAYYSAAISDFYDSHSGVEHVSVGDILVCLADHPSFSCDWLAKWGSRH